MGSNLMRGQTNKLPLRKPKQFKTPLSALKFSIPSELTILKSKPYQKSEGPNSPFWVFHPFGVSASHRCKTAMCQIYE